MDQDPIAIIGAACRLPGSKDLDQFWRVLSSGVDAVSEIPAERWTKDFYFHPNPGARGKSYTWAAGVIDGVNQLDSGFFGLSPRETEQVDPQQKLLLEVAWEALEDSGIPASRLAGEQVGVFVGASSHDYGDIRIGDPASADAYFMTGITSSILANRVSYVFDFHGPSFTVDTACSSSLVALDLACHAIREQRAPMALVGGVSLLLSPFPFIGFCRASMLSPDGRCFAFDARANGYVRAEGAAMVVLKPLSKALADGDTVRGLILATGTNSDGRTIGLSLPNQHAQTALLRSVYGSAGIAPDALSFVEAHGTGTQAGDPVELSALGEALGRLRGSALRIGSVKTNIGHLEAASGMAGLLKTMLSLQHRLIPPSLHFETPNPRIPFAELNLEIVSKATPLPERGTALIAGVNSFGFGGANAHAILAGPPLARPAPRTDVGALPPLLLSARSEAALKALARDWSGTLADAEPEKAGPMLRAAARCRDQHRLRLVAWGDSPVAIADKLDAFAANEQTASVASGSTVPAGKLAFVFSGNGVQKSGMARDALTHSRSFRNALTDLDKMMEPQLGWSVVERLARDQDPAILARTDVAQPMLFAVQVGVTAALRDAGLEASAHVGHSVGEIAAGWAAGALSMDDACKIIVERSAQQQRTQGLGGMAALGLPAEEAAQNLAMVSDELEVAAINSSRAVTVAGPHRALDRLKAEAAGKGWFYKRLDLDYAFHSGALDPIKTDLVEALAGLSPRDCGRRLISTVTGETVSGLALDADYWWRNIRDPVRFESAINHMIAGNCRIFVEIGPNPALMSYIRDGLKAADAAGRVIGSLSHRGGGEDPFPAIAAECHVAGADISGASTFDGAQDRSLLPAYPWQRQSHSVQRTGEAVFSVQMPHDHALLGFRKDAAGRAWRNMVSAETHAWVTDHRVDGIAVMPGAALLEMALAAALSQFAGAPSLEVSGFEMPRAMTVEADGSRELSVTLDADNAIEIKSRPRLSDESWTIHAVGRIAAGSDHLPVLPEAPPPSRIVGGDQVYETARRIGLDYGPVFQTVKQVGIVGERAAVVALIPAAAKAAGADFVLHPALVDGAMQAVIALLAARVDLAQGEGFLPSRFGRVRAFAPFGRLPSSARVRLDRIGSRSVLASIDLLDEHEALVAEIGDCWFQRVQMSRRDTLAGKVFRFDRVAAPRREDERPHALDVGMMKQAAGQSPGEDYGGKDYGGTALLFDAFLAAAAYDAVAGVAGPDRPFTVPDLVASGNLNVTAAPLLSDLLSKLERHGAASKEGRQWRLAASSDLPEPDILWRTILLEAPELAAELALTGAANLKSLLRDGLDSSPLPAALVEQVLYSSPSGVWASDILLRAIRTLAAGWPRDRPLRILEVGAGSGFLTRRLVDGLADWPGSLAYIASDADGAPSIRLSYERPPSVFSTLHWESGGGAKIGKGPFDVIVSMYGLTRTGYGLTRAGLNDTAIAQLYDALAPGGVLISAEAEPNAVWQSVFGANRGRPLDSVAGALAKAGFAMAAPIVLENLPWPIALLTGSRPATLNPPARPHPGEAAILIAASGDALALATAALLSRMGLAVRIINPPEVADGAELLSALKSAGGDCPRILVLPPSSGLCDGPDATRRMVEALTVARLVADASDRAQLWLVTRNAQSRKGDGELPAPAEAALWGLGRTLANEMPRLECRMVDLPARWSIEEAADALAAECADPDPEREIVWSSEGRFALKLRRGLPRSQAWASSIALGVAQPGLLDTLHWKDAGEPALPGPGEVSIDVRAAGLNFRDVMWALALLPEEALLDGFSGPSMGLECTGTVRSVGAGVAAFTPGDRVMALAPAALRSYVTTPAHAVTKLPDDMSFAEGATIPVAYLTTIYSLGAQARLQAGEWILIHGGAGGVGLAAIAYARHRGAVIVATAGSETKREFLRKLGVDHVLDSRSLSFADDVRTLTAGRGVDVVLNSLSGEAMERSLGLLKPFGRFVELGKRDFMFDTRVGLRAMRQNISYYAVDIDRLPVARPELAASLLGEVADLMTAGALHALPYRALPFADAPEAFRLMQASGHIGKIVLTADGHKAPAEVVSTLPIRSDRTYVVTGGLSGFGLETAKWLAERGARHLALLGRRGAETEGAEKALDGFVAGGVDARPFACDVSRADSLERTLSDVRAGMPPIVGVVHAAMVVDDGLASALTAKRIQTVLAPKLDGALNLDRSTRGDDIALFLLYSSATTVLGAPGQGSYVAANMGLEALARRRHAEGLPALAVAWGAISDAGYLARAETVRDALSRRLGTGAMTAREALDSLPALLASGEPVIAFAPVRFDTASQYLPILSTPAFGDVAITAVHAGSGDLRERLAELSPDEAKELITGVLVEETGRILSLSPSGIDAKRPLSEFGMDSLMAVELRLALETRLGIDMPIVALSDNTSLALIATRMMRTLSQREQAAAQPEKSSGLEEMILRHEAAATPSLDRPEPAGTGLENQVAAE